MEKEKCDFRIFSFFPSLRTDGDNQGLRVMVRLWQVFRAPSTVSARGFSCKGLCAVASTHPSIFSWCEED